MSPEERLAARLVKRLKLSPPIAIEDVLAKYADIAYDTLPADSDAVLLRRQIKKNRPLVIVDKTKHPKRRRFTLAHELGHLLIPWHIGTLSCHTSLQGEFGEELYRSTEAEANRFAAELLLPSLWMKDIIEKHDNIADIFQAARAADVSAVSACISLCKALSPGYVFVAIDDKSRIVATSKSSGTAAPLMERDKKFQRDYYDGTGGAISRWSSAATTVYWWDFTSQGEAVTEDSRSASEILQDILQDRLPASQRAQVQQSINGIIGSANSQYKPATVADLVSVARQRFAGREAEMLKCSSHDDFDLFLRRRAEEIFARRSGK